MKQAEYDALVASLESAVELIKASVQVDAETAENASEDAEEVAASAAVPSTDSSDSSVAPLKLGSPHIVKK